MITVVLRGISDPTVVSAITAVAALWDIRLIDDCSEIEATAVCLIVGPDSIAQAADPTRATKPTLCFSSRVRPIAMAGIHELSFADMSALPAPLRGQQLRTDEMVPLEGLAVAPGFATAATVEGRSIWLVRPEERGVSLIVGSPPPSLQNTDRLAEILNGETFLHALPVWVFFHALATQSRWMPPPLRACLTVDDPNLRRSTYGHIDYRALIEFARKRPFHAAMATVPLDAWSFDRATSRLFAENPRVLSLLAHGNDHLYYELAQSFSRQHRAGLVRQSLARIEVAEGKAGVAIDRVMAPPHGVCAPEMAEMLWRHGFEGMTTNRWSLWKHNPPSGLPADFGFRPADWLAAGLPVLPRFRLNTQIGRNEIILAALFGQAILPYGHHQDFSNDMAAVKETVDSVNTLGLVQWMSMREILETNFERLIDGDTLRIRLFSRRVKGALPVGLTRLCVELPSSAGSETRELSVAWSSGSAAGRIMGRIGEPVVLPDGCSFEVRLTLVDASSGTPDLPPIPGLRVLLRRLATEARDRLLI